MTGEEAVRQGYRKVSNKYRHVARIDRPDWVERMAKDLRRSPAQFYQPGAAEVDHHYCDYYRRALSRDIITLPLAEFVKVPSSCGDPCGYVPQERDKARGPLFPELAYTMAKTLRPEPCCNRCKREGHVECQCSIAMPLPYGPVEPNCRWPVPMKQSEWDNLQALCDRIPDKMLAGEFRGIISMLAAAEFEVATLRRALREGRSA